MINNKIKNILIIQTASIGDVVLATPVIEKARNAFPAAAIDFMVKDGVQDLLTGHPHLHNIIAWNKKEHKYQNLAEIIRYVRSSRYDMVINLQRFFATGLVTFLSGARIRSGFSKNPLSLFYTHRTRHRIGDTSSPLHETKRNLKLVPFAEGGNNPRPLLYPAKKAFAKVSQYKTSHYICIAPASLWYTKQYPKERWIDFIGKVPESTRVILLGSAEDQTLTAAIMKEASHAELLDLSGQLSLQESAALIRDAAMTYVNDSAVMHLASAMNAPVTAVFCSTVPTFGFGPLSDNSAVVEKEEPLYCRPCGLHGYNKCPEGHFKCAYDIDNKALENRLP
jgi:heptosyltransferase-2